MSKELQKDDIILPGGLGEVSGMVNGEVTKMTKRKDGSTTLTIQPKEELMFVPIHKTGKVTFGEYQAVEDADFEIIEPKQIKNND